MPPPNPGLIVFLIAAAICLLVMGSGKGKSP